MRTAIALLTVVLLLALAGVPELAAAPPPKPVEVINDVGVHILSPNPVPVSLTNGTPDSLSIIIFDDTPLPQSSVVLDVEGFARVGILLQSTLAANVEIYFSLANGTDLFIKVRPDLLKPGLFRSTSSFSLAGTPRRLTLTLPILGPQMRIDATGDGRLDGSVYLTK